MNEPLPFIDPTAGTGKTRLALAARPAALAGKTAGLPDNTQEQAEVILAALGEALQTRQGVAKVVIRRREHYSKPALDQFIAAMAQELGVAVAAVGGRGSCTLRGVHDTIEFERRGIPPGKHRQSGFPRRCGVPL